MAHDIAAELAGYAAELEGYERSGRDDRAAAVREQIAKLTGPAWAQIEQLRREADGYATLGQDERARQTRDQAAALEAQLPADNLEDQVDDAEAAEEHPRAAEYSDKHRGENAPQETATPTGPQHKAVPPAKRGK